VNDNKPALELIEEDGDLEKDEPEFANKGVKIIEDDDVLDADELELKEYRLRMAALLPTVSSVPD
jgi:hypothetical protein